LADNFAFRACFLENKPETESRPAAFSGRRRWVYVTLTRQTVSAADVPFCRFRTCSQSPTSNLFKSDAPDVGVYGLLSRKQSKTSRLACSLTAACTLADMAVFKLFSRKQGLNADWFYVPCTADSGSPAGSATGRAF